MAFEQIITNNLFSALSNFSPIASTAKISQSNPSYTTLRNIVFPCSHSGFIKIQCNSSKCNLFINSDRIHELRIISCVFAADSTKRKSVPLPFKHFSSLDVTDKSEQEGKEEIVKPSKKIDQVVVNLNQGRREEMEDEVSIVKNVPHGYLYAGVFDGHAGNFAARFLRDELYEMLLNELQKGEVLEEEDPLVIKEGLKSAFVNADARLLTLLEEQMDEEVSGSTATVAFVSPKKIIVAHVGDSRAVACIDGESQELCFDHRPHGGSEMSKFETQRIINAGGWISNGRVCGSVAVSRAFGDIMYKTHRKTLLLEGIKKGRWSKRFVDKLNLKEEWITASPDVFVSNLSQNCEFILLGSDGIWDVIRSSEAVRFIKDQLNSHNDAQRACDELAEFALEKRGGEDNISIILITFK